MSNKTKTQRLLEALEKGQTISVAQAMSRFGLVSPNAVTSVIRNLRDQGNDIETIVKNGTVRYTL